MLSSSEIRRYSRQLMLPQIEEEGHENIAKSHVVIIGLGGLGSLAARYLVGAGVGNVTLVDGDVVNISNLQRQVTYNEMHLGGLKAKALLNELRKVNPSVNIKGKCVYADRDNLPGIIQSAHCVLDCTDTLAVRQLINQACFFADKPLFIAAASGCTWQAINLLPNQSNSGCYACLTNTIEVREDCVTQGVLGPVVGMAACHQATQALLFLAKGSNADIKWGHYIHCDATQSTIRAFALTRSIHCKVCQ